jgi:hypothetical protein
MNDWEEIDDGVEAAIDQESPLKSADELAARVREFVRLRTVRDETKAAADAAKKEFDIYQAELFDEYSRSPLKGSINIDIGDGQYVRITPRSTKYGRILDYDKALAYFKKRHKEDEFVKQDFRMGRLHELVREHIEQKKPLPEGVDYYTKEYFTITVR